MFAHKEQSKAEKKPQIIPAPPRRSSQCIQLFAPTGLTAGFSNKHMFRPLAANSLSYIDGTEIEDSTLVKLPDGGRDLRDLYEAATPGIATHGDVDFEVPTVQYNGAAVTNTSPTANRYLQFSTDTSGRICHLENASTALPANSYTSLQALLPAIKSARKAAMEKDFQSRRVEGLEHDAIETENVWIEKIYGKKMDPITLDGHEPVARCLNRILKFILDLNTYLNDFRQKALENSGRFFKGELKQRLIIRKRMTDSIDNYISVLKDLKEVIDLEAEVCEFGKEMYSGEYTFIAENIEELMLQKANLADIITELNSYTITDLPSWIENGVEDVQIYYINHGYLYSGQYC